MKTCKITPKDIEQKWVLLDAAGMTLGRLATEVARVLRGKHKPHFVPHLVCGDCVVVTNAAQINLTGRKWDQKFYYRHTGYIGGIKGISARDLLARQPEKLVEYAVKGMLPKNKLSRKIMGNLRVYAATEHTHGPQKPEAMPVRLAQVIS